MNLNVIKLGKIKYNESLEIQKKLFDMRIQNQIDDTLLMLEHYPVITLGRRGKKENILINEDGLKKHDVEIHEINRGGDVTYHGDGQIVGYLIFDIRNHSSGIKDFVWKIEEVIIKLLKDKYNIVSFRGEKKYTGIWIDNKKIAAFGIYVSRWISMHGFSFNVNPDLSHFKWVNPCGITDKGITSLEMELKQNIDLNIIADQLIENFRYVFDVSINLMVIDQLIKSGASDA